MSRPSPLLAGVVRGLGRRHAWLAPTLPMFGILSLLSGGGVGLLLLAQRLRRCDTLHAQQLDAAGEWLDSTNRDGLADATSSLGNALTSSFATRMTVISLGALASVLAVIRTYRSASSTLRPTIAWPWLSHVVIDRLTLWHTAAVWLGSACVLGWVWHGRSAIARMTREYQDANVTLPASLPKRDKLNVALWIVASVIALAFGLLWLSASCLAGAGVVGYIGTGRDRWRHAVGEHVRSLAESDDPSLELPPRVESRDECDGDGCREKKLIGAAFCPRCGTAAM